MSEATQWTVRKCGCGLIWPVSQNWCQSCMSNLFPASEIVVTQFEAHNLDGPGQARSTDPETAKTAAKIVVRRGTQRWKVLESIRQRDQTAGELVKSTGIQYASLTPRIGELKRGGYIRATDVTRKSESNVDQEVLTLTTPIPYTGPDPYDGSGDEARLSFF